MPAEAWAIVPVHLAAVRLRGLVTRAGANETRGPGITTRRGFELKTTCSRRALSAFGAIAGFLLVCQSAAANTEALDGFWMDSDGEVILEIGPCAAGQDSRCGRVAWLKQPLGADGMALLDVKNPDPALRSRPVCGLTVVSGFAKQTAETWGGGTVYVSDYGSSFSGTAEVLSQTQVKVTGYVGITFFGSSEVWTRVTHKVTPCWSVPQGVPPPGTAPQGKAAAR